MSKNEFNQKAVIKYLAFTFGVAYVIQFTIGLLARRGVIGRGVEQIVMAAMMFVPAVGVLAAGEKLSGMGWKPQIRKNIKWFLAAWFGPAILTVLGTVLYFLIFPAHFDLSGQFLIDAVGPEAIDQLAAQGLTYPMYILINFISSLVYAPLINMIAALGEEIGWRGFLYPQLKAKYGPTRGLVYGGIIWGAWHWPLIALIGYEYGMSYIGFPVTGMILFCLCTGAMGIICDWLYVKGKTIWLPSLCHGAFNAVATVTLAVCAVGTGSFRLLGPAPNGLLSGLPLFLAAVLLIRKSSAGTEEN